jgi:formate-dependent nitrite reductase cytochrome c552 subunit
MAEYRIKAAQLDYFEKFEDVEQLIEQQSRATDDFKSVPAIFEANIDVKLSAIAGLGLFSRQYFKPGDHIAPARIKGFRTEAGKYCNHSCFPNAAMQCVSGDVALIATSYIKPGEEILTDYMCTLHSIKEATCLV